jgi:subtilisin family serine protease
MYIDRILAGLLALVFLIVPDASLLAGTSVQPGYVAGEMLVKFRKDPVQPERGVLPLSRIQTFQKSGISRVKVPEDMTVDQAVADYNARPDVVYAEPNYRYRLQALPDDPQMHRLWALVNHGQTIHGLRATVDADLDAEQAWDLSTGSSDVIVAVVDSGVDIEHPDLSGNIWTNPDEIVNGIDDDGNGYIDDVHGWDFTTHTNDPVDTHGHGTRVAGIIGAVGNNAIGISGVCWKVSIMPLRFISAADYGTVANAIDAIEYADAKGASVINLSWGGPDYSQALKDAIDAAGALVVCAAGNQGRDLALSPNYPASYDSANILSVGASNMNDAPAWFTNYSDHWVDVAAPGTDILSTVPNRRTLYADPDDLNDWDRLGPLDLSKCTGARLDFAVQSTTAGTADRLYVEA